MSTWITETDKVTEVLDSGLFLAASLVLATMIVSALYSWTRKNARTELEGIQGETGGWLDEWEPVKGNRSNDR